MCGFFSHTCSQQTHRQRSSQLWTWHQARALAVPARARGLATPYTNVSDCKVSPLPYPGATESAAMSPLAPAHLKIVRRLPVCTPLCGTAHRPSTQKNHRTRKANTGDSSGYPRGHKGPAGSPGPRRHSTRSPRHDTGIHGESRFPSALPPVSCQVNPLCRPQAHQVANASRPPPQISAPLSP